MAQNMENIDFRIFLLYLHSNSLYWSKTVIFEFLGTFVTRSIGYFAKVALFFEKMQKVVKNKAQGCYTPLSNLPSQIIKSTTFKSWNLIWNIHSNF